MIQVRSIFAFMLCAAVCISAIPARAQPSRLDIVVAATTDVHGDVRAWDYFADTAERTRGLSRVATIVDSVRSANPGRVVLVDAGDFLQGNPFAHVVAHEKPSATNAVITAMNAMRYDAATIGNHDYDYGVRYLESAARQARFPFISANTTRLDGAAAFTPWTIAERQGVKIGIVGATTPGVMVWDADQVRGHVRVGDIIPPVQKAVRDARSAGAEIIVVSAHTGLDEPSTYDSVATALPSDNVAARIARAVQGVDLIVYGHSHKPQQAVRIENTVLTQPGFWAASLSVIHLNLVKTDGRWTVESAGVQLIPATGHAESASVLAATAAAHERTLAFVRQPIGETAIAWRADSSRLKDTPIVDFILETERKTTGAQLASTPSFSLDASLKPGTITVAQIARLYPYSNTLKAIRISGRQLRDYLEWSNRYYKSGDPAPVVDTAIPGYNYDIVSGAEYAVDLSRPVGSRIVSLSVNGKPVVATDTFTLALNNYRQSGAGGYSMFRGARVVYDKQQDLRQLLIDEVIARKTLKPEDYFKQNWRLTYGTSQAVARPSDTLVVPPPALPRGAPRLRIIATNDFHGALESRPDANGVMRGGAAYVAAMISAAKKECAPTCVTLLLDGGDLFQGTPASNLAYGRPVVAYYNEMGYAASALGNHEFDWGLDTLRARMRDAHFAILGANVRYADGRDVPWIRDDTIITRGRTRIGVIGFATVTTPTQTLASNVAGLRFDDPAPIISARAKALRRRGADVVIVTGHSGAFCTSNGMAACNGEIIDVARALTERVDAIVSAHTHSLVDFAVNGMPVVQARSSGRALAIIDIPLKNGKPSGQAHYEVRDVVDSALAPDARVAAIVKNATDRVAPFVNRKVTEISATYDHNGNQYPLGNLIADAQRWAGKGDIAVMNNGGIRAALRSGTATYGSLFEIQPFGNTLYRLRMNGTQLREYLERIVDRNELRDHVSGVKITYDPALPQGQRIVSATLANGSPIVNATMYNVIVNNFMATGGEGMGPPPGATSTPLNVVDLDALVNYLKTLPSPVIAPAEVRVAPVQK